MLSSLLSLSCFALLISSSPHGLIWQSKSGAKKKWTIEGERINTSGLPEKVTAVLDKLLPPAERIPANDALTGAIRRQRFVGGANFWYTTRNLFGLNYDGTPKKNLFSFQEFQDEVRFTRGLTWEFIKARRSMVDENFLAKAWFNAEWISQVLFNVFRVDIQPPTSCYVCGRADDTPNSATLPRHEDQLSFRPYNGPGGSVLTWTLGRAVLLATGDHKPEINLGRLVILQNETKKRIQKLKDEAEREDAKSRDLDYSLKSFESYVSRWSRTNPKLYASVKENEAPELAKTQARMEEHKALAAKLRETADKYQKSIDIANDYQKDIFSKMVEQQKKEGLEAVIPARQEVPEAAPLTNSRDDEL